MRQAIILTVLCGLLALSLPAAGFAVEINFTEHLIDGNLPIPGNSFGIDLDDDGDVDVLATSQDADEVAWWENDGSQNFTKHTISNTFDGAYRIYAIDLDGDDDVDVLGAALYADDIAWWENDGDENFTKHIIDDNIDYPHDVYAIDIDGDEDVDVLGAAYYANEIAWWENDGHQNFTKHTIDGGFGGAIAVFAIDLDNDDDIDVLGGAYCDSRVAWWENDGAQNFAKYFIDPYFYRVTDVVGVDLDQDRDVDVLAGGGDWGDGLWWYENDSYQNFTPHQIAGYPRNLMYINVVDLEADGDLDVLSAEFWEGAIRWWENDGNENFTEHTAIHLYHPEGVYTVDLDQDGDWDVLAVSTEPGALYWFESGVNPGPPLADVSGTVSGPDGGLFGVSVDIFDSQGALYASTATDESGYYLFQDVPNGDYTVSIVTTLGYIADSESKEITVAGEDVICDFYCDQVEIVYEQRSVGFWKHQVNVYLSGRGRAQIPQEEFCGYLDDIAIHFNSNRTNPIAVYTVEQPADQRDSLEAANALLGLTGNVPMLDRARQQLMALLLNVVSGKLPQFASISEDEVSASQAITYCYDLITDGDGANDELAKDIADQINNNITIAAGVIPLDTPDISYKGSVAGNIALPATYELLQNYPNPFNASTEITYALAEAGDVKLTIYNLGGQLIETLVDEYQDVGEHQAIWDASNYSSGLYFYKLTTSDFVETRRMTLLK